MTQLLLDDKCGITLSDEEQCVLIEILSCSVRRASGATPPPGRAKGKVNNCLAIRVNLEGGFPTPKADFPSLEYNLGINYPMCWFMIGCSYCQTGRRRP